LDERGFMDLEGIAKRLEQFAEERDWEQYHSPKNLAISLGVEVGELLEIFQWLPDNHDFAGDEAVRSRATEEIADIFIYAIMLGQKLDINVEEAILRKISLNEKKYPVEKAKGSSKKYSELG
jgi:NTP pyrophosphatase (non-canonical NTP hydrolase)